MARISQRLRQQVAERANFLCEYCRSSEEITGGPFQIEHILPEVAGGKTVLRNLAYACVRCNMHKAARTRAVDPLTQQIVPLFHPRLEQWHEHFDWSEDGSEVIGITPLGRASARALNMNDRKVVSARKTWVVFGKHPPA